MIKGIIFDKDGTLINFHALWDGVGARLATEFLERAGLTRDAELEAELSRSIGVLPDGVAPAGAFACGTYAECGALFARALERFGYGVTDAEAAARLCEISDETSCSKTARYEAVCDLHKLFGDLRTRGIHLGLVTGDTQAAAEYFADRLSLRGYFDFIEGADFGAWEPKPHRASADRFRALTGIRAGELAIVGDSCADMRFARNADAVAIAVLSGVGGGRELRETADFVMPNVEYIYEIIRRTDI
ncbi:MAG: HAD family hydrolase [Oscillospiraceae bacterium]|jgi:phosphoglycolate phosphatase|nr:HAD family hydrolase [Oscillospiraceae bacterium]